MNEIDEKFHDKLDWQNRPNSIEYIYRIVTQLEENSSLE